MTTKDQEILDRISELKNALLVDRPNKDKPEESKLSELKEHLINKEPGLVTRQWLEKQLPEKFAERFQAMYDELTKAKKTEWLEAMGLDGFASALEKFHEGSKWWPVYLLSGFMGLAVPAFIAILALNLKVLQRGIQKAVSKFFTGRETVLATSDSGRGIRPQNATTVEGREANGAVTGTNTPPDPATLEPLYQKLGQVNRRILVFNKGIKRMASPRELGKLATGIGKVNDAVEASRPETIETLATHVGTLKTVMADFKPGRIPQDLQNTRTETRNLGRTVDELKTSFQQLKEEATRVATVLA
ncbi:hypothetical protein [Streptomyces sp. NPDC058758]|uniref:hypothetical protein n=1 Tax=Streptomyces sp. NPDC058758 TaxID=3346627 RepID=UPI00369B7889